MRGSCVFLLLTIIIGIGSVVYVERVFEEERFFEPLEKSYEIDNVSFLPNTEKTFIIDSPTIELKSQSEITQNNVPLRRVVEREEFFSSQNPQDNVCTTSKSFNAAGRSFNNPRSPYLRRSESWTRRCFVEEKNEGLGILVGFY